MSEPSPIPASAPGSPIREIPFPPAAVRFVREGLAHTSGMIFGDTPPVAEGESRHITGQQLCLGLRDFALRQYGMLARTVLARWGIRRTEDFGTIVYGLIDAGQLRRSREDAIEDFANVYDFDEAFATFERA